MSFALTPASFSSGNSKGNNKTQKYRQKAKQHKLTVSQPKQKVSFMEDDDDNASLASFHPPEPEPLVKKGEAQQFDLEETREYKNSEEPYTNLTRNYHQLEDHLQYVPHSQQTSSPGQYVQQSELLEKLNYIIQMMEDEKDEKTGHVMEELILYSFLGVFLIFMTDSFAKVGKYIR